MNKFTNWLDKRFEVSRQGSSLTTECRAGITTFLTMLYILVVNPTILSKAIAIPGVDLFPELMTTTAIVIFLGSCLMGILANYPFAIAPGMGLNAFFAYSVVLGMGLSWQVALASVFLGGILFLLVTTTGLRSLLAHAIPMCLKKASAAGIGLFLGLLGFIGSGTIVKHDTTLVSLGDLTLAGPLLTGAGLVITVALMVRKVPGALLLGIIAVTVLAMLSGAPVFNGQAFNGFESGIMHMPIWPSHLMFAMDLKGAMNLTVAGVIFSFFFISLFDAFGSITALAERGKFVSENGQVPRLSKAFLADAGATTLAGLVGCSAATPFAESAAGIGEGGKTGLTAIVVGILFLITLFFWPIASMIPAVATAPALIIVGAMMVSACKGIEWENLRESIPAFLTLLGIPLTYSIADGVALGVISYVGIHLLAGEGKKIHPILYILSVLLSAMLVL